MRLVIALLLVPSAAWAQLLVLERNRFTDNTTVLPADSFMSRENLRFLRRMNSSVPEPVAVGSVEGVTFFYRATGVGFVATDADANWQRMSAQNSWLVECTRDAMNDSLSCRLTRDDLTLIFLDTNLVGIFVGANHYPHSEIAVRIDTSPALRADAPGFAASQSADIIAQLAAGRVLATRYQQWPYQAYVDKRTSLYGFRVAVSLARWMFVTSRGN